MCQDAHLIAHSDRGSRSATKTRRHEWLRQKTYRLESDTSNQRQDSFLKASSECQRDSEAKMLILISQTALLSKTERVRVKESKREGIEREKERNRKREIESARGRKKTRARKRARESERESESKRVRERGRKKKQEKGGSVQGGATCP